MSLSPNHFLALPRPDALVGPPAGVVDTTTLAAHDFDVDTRTGFMPPDPPLVRLSTQYEPWEQLLDDAQTDRLQLGSKHDITDEETAQSESWRARVRQIPIISTTELRQSELLLRRAHHVLAWVMHFYIHSLPTTAEIRIPAPITVPLLEVCEQLQLPPVITYADDVLYNWALKVPSEEPTPALDNLRSLALFTGTSDEEEFYLTSARIELRGVDALEVMRVTMDELFIGDALATRRITRYLHSLSRVIDDLARLILSVRDGCDPDVFYHAIRPWFNGADSGTRRWHFEGLDTHPHLVLPDELSGPSAAQSPLIHSLDVFLGIDHTPSPSSSPKMEPTRPADEHEPSPVHVPPKAPFLVRMRSYMPRHHRNFLRHLAATPRPLREAVARTGDAALTDAYNASLAALRRLRDSHLRLVALYIVGPSHRAPAAAAAKEDAAGAAGRGCSAAMAGRGCSASAKGMLRGTGGTDLIRFLKGVRDRTSDAALELDG